MFYDLSSFHDSFIPELGQHLQHVDADLLRLIIQTGADDAEAVWCQYPPMQLSQTEGRFFCWTTLRPTRMAA